MPSAAILETLNPAQLSAATFGARGADGGYAAPPLLVIAGAGTGKTATLAHRVAHLVAEGVEPGRILLLTFTRRAAQEMVKRAERIVAGRLRSRGARPHQADVRLPWSGTFHAIGNRLLRQYHAAVGLEASFSIMDRGDSADLLDVLRHDLGLSKQNRRFPRKDTCQAIYSHRVNTGWPLERVLDEVYPWCAEWRQPLSELFGAYVDRKQANGVLDYDDLLLYWHAMMEEPALAVQVGARFDHVLVDEYQDTNALQAGILLRLKPAGAGLTVVGDDAQAIYSFRAATVDNILGFPGHFAPPAEVIALEENYRSTQQVLDAANALIAEGRLQYRKTLRAVRGAGAKPRLVTVLDDRAQCGYIVGRILANREAGVLLRRQAVLFRSAHHSDGLELELMRRNIPYVKYGGLKFLEAAHVKDLLGVLRWADNPRNGLAAFRVLQLMPGMGPANAERCLAAVAAGGHALGALADFMPPPAARDGWRHFATLMADLAAPALPWAGQVERVRDWYQPLLDGLYDHAGVRAGDLDMLGQIATQFASRERFLSELTLDPPRATGDLAGPPLLDEDYLVLSTVHSAKGQEWDAVFVLNVADGNFPSEFAAGRDALIEEERRLLYVAMTRARRELDLLEPQRYYVTQQHRHGDAHVYGARSRFLTPAVMDSLQCTTWGETPLPDGAVATDLRVDIGKRLRDMW